MSTSGFEMKGNMRRADAGLCWALPVKSTFPYRSWICGARPSLKRYRLRMATATQQRKPQVRRVLHKNRTNHKANVPVFSEPS